MDEYARADLEVHLATLSPQQRIEFIRTLVEENNTVRESVGWRDTPALKEILTRDKSVAVRAWAARTFGFDELLDDESPLVRAAAWESTERWVTPVFQEELVIKKFSELSQLERCAWIRSRSFPLLLLLLVFDLNIERTGLTHEELQELILAFLSGDRHPVVESNRNDTGSDRFFQGKHYLQDKLWQCAEMWPSTTREEVRDGVAGGIYINYKFIRAIVFENIDASDGARVEIFRRLNDRNSRMAILRGSSPISECLWCALGDDDEAIRGYAWARYAFDSRDEEEEWRCALEGFDLVALRGLCRNRALSVVVRRQEVLKRLSDLGDGVIGPIHWLLEKACDVEIGSNDPQRSLGMQLDELQTNVKKLRLIVNLMAASFVVFIVLLMVRLVP